MGIYTFNTILLLICLVTSHTAQTTPYNEKLIVSGVWEESGNRLPDNWTPPPLAQCSDTAAGVGYPGDGNTCGFHDWISYMPKIYTDGYIVAASTDYINGWHYPDNWKSNPRSPEWDACEYKNVLANFSESNYTKMCAQSCGECLLVSGSHGSHVYIINEIGDINAVGISGQGVNFAFGWGAGFQQKNPAPCLGSNNKEELGECSQAVIDGHGWQAVTYKRVPCPVTGSIKLALTEYEGEPLKGNNVAMTPINYKINILSMWVRGGYDATDKTWMWVPRKWTNSFDFYPSNGLNGYVFKDSPTKTFDVQFLGGSGEMLVCSNIVYSSYTPHSTISQRGILDLKCQFSDPQEGDITTPCDGPLPPPYIYHEQVYSYKTCNTLDYCECTPGSNGCNTFAEGAFLQEWRLFLHYGLPSLPNLSYNVSCHSGSYCIDTGTSTGYAGIGLQWRQDIIPNFYNSTVELEFWAICKTTSCKLAVGFDDSTCSPSTVSIGPVSTTQWTRYNVSLNVPPLSTCGSWKNVRFDFGPNQQFIIDDIRFVCNGNCSSLPPPTWPPSMLTPSSGYTFPAFSVILVVLSILSILVIIEK